MATKRYAGIFRWGGVVSVTDIVSFVDRFAVFMLSMLFISGFAGYLPVFSYVLALKSLIINTIHFSDSLRVKLWLLKGMHAIAGWVV